MNRIRNTNDRLVDVIVFYPKKKIKLEPVTPLIPLEALLIPVNLTDSDSDGINGGTGCNFIFYLFMYFSVFTLLATPFYIREYLYANSLHANELKPRLHADEEN